MSGLNDLTGQFISSTYQKLLQLSSSGEVTDGTGSIVNLVTSNTFNSFTSSYYIDSGSFDFRILALSAKPPAETDPIFTAALPSLATTGSNTFIGNQVITGSLAVTAGITGSLYGTSSWAINAVTASYAIAASDIVVTVLNQSGAPISRGAVVHISGSDNASDTPRVRLADWTNDALSANTLGLASTTIPNGSIGTVLTEGLFLGYDTSTPGWSTGQLLYLGPNGTITGSAPQAPLHNVRVGQVIRVNQNNGSLYVRIDNGYEINELHDVKIDTPATGDLLMYSGSVWINTPATQTKERRYDSSGSYAYCGTAVYGALEASSVWSITRLFISSSGNTTITSASMVDWTNRYTHTYY